jgi:hypothetical protein
VERDRNGDLTTETTCFTQLWLDWDSALAALRQNMVTGHDLFGRPTLSARSAGRADQLRDVALDHIRAIDRLTELCQSLEHQIDGDPPALTR